MHLSQNKFKRKDVGPWTWRENMELCSLSLLKTPQLALPPHLLVELGWGPRLAGPPAASAPPMKGKEVSPILDMQKLRIPAVCLSARGYNMMAAMLRGTCPVPGR